MDLKAGPAVGAILVTLLLSLQMVNACSCARKSQWELDAIAEWAIEGVINSTDLVKSSRWYDFRINSTHKELHEISEELIVYGVEITKVIKEQKSFEQDGFVNIYTSAYGASCGVPNLKLNSTCILQGNYHGVNNTASIGLCNPPRCGAAAFGESALMGKVFLLGVLTTIINIFNYVT